MALQALSDASRQHGKNKDVLPSLTPHNLAEAWRVHPSSAFRVLERLRAGGAVTRAGAGLNAEYEITEKGLVKLEWLTAKAVIEARAAKARKPRQRGAAANPEE
jgi:DNA-binding PadR family transcriptional regulator